MWRGGRQPQLSGWGRATGWSGEGGSWCRFRRTSSRCTRQGGPVYTTAGVLNPGARCVNTGRRVGGAKELVMSAGVMLRSFAAGLGGVLGGGPARGGTPWNAALTNRRSPRLNSSPLGNSYAVFLLYNTNK